MKLDVEGAEFDALKGAAGILNRGATVWAVCVYHKQGDMWQLPLPLHASVPAEHYRFFLRKHGGEIFDTVCYAVPSSRLSGPASDSL